MTEAEWLACNDPEPMLGFLRGKASDRKLRLFLVACARLVWDQLTVPVLRRGVETVEQYADGLASSEELRGSHNDIYEHTSFGGLEWITIMGVPHEICFWLMG